MLGRRISVALSLVVTTMALGVQTPAAATDGTTTTFDTKLEEQQYVVPAGVWNVKVVAVGGAGGCFFGGDFRDFGDRVTATLEVTPGQVLYVYVGGNGATGGVGGINGGGDGGGGGQVGGGGGASDVRLLGHEQAGPPEMAASRVVVAGGGAGGGENNSDCDGVGTESTVGQPGTATAGGTGGTSTSCSAGDPGFLGGGGHGGVGFGGICAAGGGGGGGLYGGGGGGGGGGDIPFGSAGGRGSSGAPGDPSAVIVRDLTADPRIEITPVFAPRAGFVPAPSTFATQTVGTTSASEVVSVTNVGSEPMTISGISFTGAQAAEFFTTSSTCGASLAIAASCQVGVAFAPKGAGTRAATMVLETNSDIPSTVGLTGAAVSNQFTFVKLTRNTTKGTAKVVVKVPGPGLLKLTGQDVKAQRKSVASASNTGLSVIPKAGLQDRLARAGEVRVQVKVTYTPSGGVSRSKTKWVRLVLA